MLPIAWFVNKVFETKPPELRHLHIPYGHICITMADLRSCNKNFLAPKPKVFSVCAFIEKLSNLCRDYALHFITYLVRRVWS